MPQFYLLPRVTPFRAAALAAMLALLAGGEGRASEAAGRPEAARPRAFHPSLIDWAARKREEAAELHAGSSSREMRFNTPVPLPPRMRPLRLPSGPEALRNAATLDLYAGLVGRDSVAGLVWTGIESGNPLTRNEGFRWDSLQDQALFDPARRAALAQRLLGLGIRNIRLGLSNHRIEAGTQASWREHDALVADLAGAGLRISLDLHHFGIEDRFRVSDKAGRTVPEASYYLNPAWPDYFARFSREAAERYGSQVVALTLVNEPETTVGFNSQMWHGAYPGWGSREHDRVYIERAIRLAQGAVKARIAIEEVMARKKRRVLFVHPEAAVYKPYWADFNRFVRFFASDLILGHTWLLAADLEAVAARSPAQTAARWAALPAGERGSLDWAVEHYAGRAGTATQVAARRDRLVSMLRELKALHQELARAHGVTMKTNTLFGVDYYAHNEDRDGAGRRLSAQPQYYARQVADGRRSGLYPTLVDYFNRYQMPVMIAESGTPYYHYGARWHGQMLLELAQAAGQGMPVAGYTLYPAIDTWGWETALSVPKSETMLNPGGIFDLALAPRPFAARLMNDLTRIIPPHGDQASAPTLKLPAEATRLGAGE